MLAGKIVEAVRSVIGDGPHALHEPLFIGNEQKYVADAIASGWVAQGDYIERFEQMLCGFTGVKYAVATCNATCGLRASFKKDDTYWTYKKLGQPRISVMTFIATANACHPLDIELTSHEKTNVPVHLLGHKSVAGGYVHDAAQALGTEGIYGDNLVVHSFNGNKIITTGGGGAILTNDREAARKIRHYISQCRISHPYKIEHDWHGINYRMPNINAALGCAQMEQLPYILKAKRALAQKYIEAFDSMGVKVWKEPEGTKSNYWLVAIILDDPVDQEPTLQALHSAGYQARMLPTPLHMLPMYKNCPRDKDCSIMDLSRSEDLWRRTICLPSSPKLGVPYA